MSTPKIVLTTAEWERIAAAGSGVLFREGDYLNCQIHERHPNLNCRPGPPAEFVEAAQPCERKWHGFSLWSYNAEHTALRRYLAMQPRTYIEMPDDDWRTFTAALEREGLEIKEHETHDAHSGVCPDCLDGKRRVAVVVPCRVCQDLMATVPHVVAKGEHPDGLITVGHVVVTWGPLVVVDEMSMRTVGWPLIAVVYGQGRVWVREETPDGVATTVLDLPPDIDPQSLVGQYAIGVEVVS